MPDKLKPLVVWVLSDGRPGHYNQSKGIVNALELLGPVQIEWLEVELRLGFLRKLLKAILNLSKRPLPEWLLAACFRIPGKPETGPDILVSAGGKTSFLNAALARQYGSKNVFAGSLRGLSDLLFTVVLTVEPIPGAQRNIVVDLAPSIIDAEQLRTAGALYRQERGLADCRLWAMVLGGDGAGYLYEEGDWLGLAEIMTSISAKFGIKWLLTTSRRTGRAAESVLQNMLPPETLADAVWYAQEPRKVMQAFLGASEIVFCSEDSMSMITEAISSAKPVYSFRPAKATPDLKYRNALERFAGRGWLARKVIPEAGNEQVDFELCTLTPLEESPSRRLALQLNEALGLKRPS